jgi:hypothetical protein
MERTRQRARTRDLTGSENAASLPSPDFATAIAWFQAGGEKIIKGAKRVAVFGDAGETMTTTQLVDELASDSAVTIDRARIEAHVKNGRAHAYPDCCIRAYVRFQKGPGVEYPAMSNEEDELTTLAHRRLCDECKQKVLEHKSTQFFKKELKVEQAFSYIRQVINKIATARKQTPTNQASEQAAQAELPKYIDHFVKVRNKDQSGY